MKSKFGKIPDYFPAVDLLLHQKKFQFHITTTGMVPSLCPGDIVDIHPVTTQDLRVGDIVVNPMKYTLRCHRLMRSYTDKHGKTWLITKADVWPHEDDPIEANKIVGRIVKVTRPRAFARIWLWIRRKILKHVLRTWPVSFLGKTKRALLLRLP
ncbi:MAG: S24/S26 family peptidase [Bdellovibrionota bacterium]